MVFLHVASFALRLLICFFFFVYAITGKQGNVYNILAKGQGKTLNPFFRVLSLLLGLTMLAGAYLASR
jgi:succinate dehydrogenase hydrophobic anchor subunit